ncbi:hypothetical protein QJQ45_002308 [Haematococcus lacustris]|nr:hypothetical protein QJQ45_002308 [Haematococcus lacustris]
MQRIGESRWRPLELCYWPDQGALPAKGKEYPGLGYKRLRDKPPQAQQQQQPAVAQAAYKFWNTAKLSHSDLLMRVIKADVELGRSCQASWSAQFQLAARELMGDEFTLSPDMVLGTKAMEVKWLERQAGSCIGSQAAMAAIRQQKYNGKNTDTYVVMLKVQARKFTATWAFEFVEGIAKAFCKRCPRAENNEGAYKI